MKLKQITQGVSRRNFVAGLGGAGMLSTCIDALRTGAPLHQPITEGNVAVTLMQLANISCFTGHGLHLDANESIQNNGEALVMTRCAWEKDWELKASNHCRSFRCGLHLKQRSEPAAESSPAPGQGAVSFNR